MARSRGRAPKGTLCGLPQVAPDDLRQRLAFLSFGREDRRNLPVIRAVVRAHVDELIREFYAHLNGFKELRRLLSEPGRLELLQAKQRRYLLSLGRSADYLRYAEERIRIGLAHERIGLEQKWYLGAYHKLFELILRRLPWRSARAGTLVSTVNTLHKLLRFDEILVVDTYYYATKERLEGALHQLKQAHLRLERVSRLDTLTHINNRRALMEGLQVELQRSRRYAHPFALLFIDIDRFKEINDRYGHAFGDKVLHKVAQTIGAAIRPPDILGRYGGEEFIVGLVECNLEGARRIAERIRLKIARTGFIWEKNRASVTVSIGAAAMTAGADRLNLLIEQADRALYQGKAKGRNRTEVFTGRQSKR